jgi:hypothetical protein
MKSIVKIVISLMLVALTNFAINAQQGSPELNKKNTVEVDKDSSQGDYKDWQKVELGQYSFYIPKDFKLKEIQGIDAIGWEYKSDDFYFIVIQGPYAPGPGAYGRKIKSIKYKPLLIDKVVAQMWFYEDESETYKFVGAINFQPPKFKVDSVTIYLKSKDCKGQELAEKIFLSIKFNDTSQKKGNKIKNKTSNPIKKN